MKGNVNLNAPLKASGDITVKADSLNANNAVLYSENGDILITGNNVSVTGLLYAPNGDIKILAQNVNLNSVVVIADTITLENGNANVNSNQKMAEIIGAALDAGETKPTMTPTATPILTPTTLPTATPLLTPTTLPTATPLLMPTTIPTATPIPTAPPTEPEEPKPQEEPVIFLLGEYNAEAKAVDLEWYTNVTESAVSIWSSEDNAVYERITVVDVESAYQYAINEDFETKYIKASVTDEEGNTVETVPFVVTKEEDGYEAGRLDSDKDGLADEYEALVGTDANNPDTDGDGLTDYEEIGICETDPVKYDSVVEGVSDAEADSDSDRLSNREELNYATDAQNPDTDNDGLSDYEELKVHNTDPLKADTDGDSVKDGDELALGLDPKNPKTHGVLDAEYKVEQVISAESEVLAKINTEENPYRLSVAVKASGYVEGSLEAQETRYAAAVQNECMVGAASELSCMNEEGIEEVTLSFEIDEAYVQGAIGLFPESEELSGIKRFNVFKYFEDINMLLPIETEVDVENNRIYATTDELGTYCVMDMELWLASFNVPEDIYMETPATFSMKAEKPESEFAREQTRIEYIGTSPEMDSVDAGADYDMAVASMMYSIKRPAAGAIIDAVFLLQSSGQREAVFEDQKNMICELLEDLNSAYEQDNIRASVIYYNLSGAEFLAASEDDIWFTDADELQQALEELTYENTSDHADRGIPLKKLQDEVEFKQNASKFVFQLTNGSSEAVEPFLDKIVSFKELGINYSKFMTEGYSYNDPEYAQKVAGAIADTNGMDAIYGSASLTEIYQHILTYAVPVQTEFDVIVPIGWKHIVLDGMLDPDNGVNSDTDELTDWEEVDTERICREEDGTIILPTIQECIDFAEKPYAQDGLARYKTTMQVPGMPSSDFQKYLDYVLNSTRILPIFSDPTAEDSDGDGLLDGTRQFYKGKVLLPADQEPLLYNGPTGVWLKQAEMVREKKIPTKYTSHPSYDNEMMNAMAEKADLLVDMLLYMKVVANEAIIDFVEKHFKESAEGTAALVAGADFLDFVRDNKFMAYHSQVETWQKAFGYNDVYDKVFEYGSNMKYKKMQFIYDEMEYVIWMWKGDYWNLQGGAETGLYVYDRTVNGIDHYNVVDFNLPMTLSLFRRSEEGIENVFSWAPDEEQWWITGFNPDYTEPNPKDMITICSIDFTGKSEMWESIEKYLSEYDNVMFDKEYHTLWIMWDK